MSNSTFSFEPEDDVTVQELAEIMKRILVVMIDGLQGLPSKGDGPLEIELGVYRALPQELKRHFKEPSKSIYNNTGN